jgi:hypothetical protein
MTDKEIQELIAKLSFTSQSLIQDVAILARGGNSDSRKTVINENLEYVKTTIETLLSQ